MLIEQIIELELRGPGHPSYTCTLKLIFMKKFSYFKRLYKRSKCDLNGVKITI